MSDREQRLLADSPTRGTARNPVRTSVVGLDWAATDLWLPALRRHPAFAVTSVVDPGTASHAELAHDRAGTRFLPDVAELDASATDLAVVTGATGRAAVACRLLRMGVPVLLDQPLGLNSAEVEQLAAAERAGGAVLLAGGASRHRADLLALRRVVTENLGELRHLELSWTRADGLPESGGWFAGRRFAGGGALLDLALHLLDTVGPILGPVGFDQAAGTVPDEFADDRTSPAPWGTAAEDTARGFLVTEDGVSVAIRSRRSAQEPHDVTRIRVDGSAGSATLSCTFGFTPDSFRNSSLVRYGNGGAGAADAPQPLPLPLPREEVGAEYLRHLDELPALLADPASRGRAVEEARRTLAVVERIHHSARRPRPAARPARAARTAPPSTLLGFDDLL